MNPVLRNFSRFISISLLGVAVARAGELYPVAATLQALRDVPYRLYARPVQTERAQALNCFTAVYYALQRIYPQCAGLDIRQARAYWWSRARPLRTGESLAGPGGALLLSRDHFLLLAADRDGNGVIDASDPVIHAYYRPLEINRLDEWQAEAGRPPVRYLPLDDGFPCPTAVERRGMARR